MSFSRDEITSEFAELSHLSFDEDLAIDWWNFQQARRRKSWREAAKLRAARLRADPDALERERARKREVWHRWYDCQKADPEIWRALLCRQNRSRRFRALKDSMFRERLRAYSRDKARAAYYRMTQEDRDRWNAARRARRAACREPRACIDCKAIITGRALRCQEHAKAHMHVLVALKSRRFRARLRVRKELLS